MMVENTKENFPAVTGTGTSSSFIAGTAGRFSLVFSTIIISPLVYSHQSFGSGHGRVEERRDNSRQHGRRVDIVMRCGGANGEPGIGYNRPPPTAHDPSPPKPPSKNHSRRGAGAARRPHPKQRGPPRRRH